MNAGSIQLGMTISANGVSTEPVSNSMITGSAAGGTYGLSTQCPTTTGT